MADAANHLVPGPGRFRALSFVWAWLQNMEYSGFQYTMDRMEVLEREVGLLREELRQIRDTGAVDSRNDSVAGPQH